MLIQNPYFSDVPDIPQRGRFEPFDFQGTAFSQGGYSAQYGQALSAIVDLKTWSRFGDFNANTFSITPLSLSYGRAYGNDSTICGTTIDYTNLKYFQDINNNGILADFIKSRINFSNPVETLELKTNYSKKFNSGIFKYLGRISESNLATSPSEIGSNFNLENKNKFILSTYRGEINKSTRIQLGFSYSDNEDDANIIFNNEDAPINLPSYDDLYQFRTVLIKNMFSKSKMKLGYHLFDQKSEFSYYIVSDSGISDDYIWNQTDVNVNELLQTSFFELDLRLFKKFAINTGIRFENSKLLGKSSTSPRFSSAFT
jgi:outer membrane receptor for ferrienterochelin and colicin